MQLSAHQIDEAQLTQLGLEATALIRAGDLAAAVARFGYALAQEREPSVALQEDLADCLAQLGAGALAPDQPIATIVRYLAENDSGLFAAVECRVPADNGSAVLVELIVTSKGAQKHLCLEQISAAA